MALDPRIILGGRAPDIGAAFSNALLNVQRGQQISQTAAQAPLQNRLLEAQVSGAESADVATQQTNRLRSLALFGSEIAQDLQTGNLASIRAKTVQRISQDLPGQGLPSNDSQELLALIDDPNISEQDKISQIGELSTQAITRAQQFGILKAPTAAQRTKFIGTPSRTTRDGQNFLTGVVQNPDGTFKTISQPVDGEFVSILGETAEGEVETEIQKQIRLAALELQTKPGIEAAVVTAKGAAEAETEIGATSLAVKRLAMDETKIKNDQDRLELIGAKEASIAESTNAISRINGLLTGDRFSAGFGKLVTNTPETLRSQEAIDVIAELDQIRGLVSLESRQKLKGQGTISDSEAKTLERSATVLSNPLISDKLARKELLIIKKVFEKSTERNQLAKSTREQRLVKQPAEGAAELTEGVIIVNPATGERMQVVNNELVVI